MKPIELTEEHKSKLLEMCKILFPEYTKIDLEIEDNYDGTKNHIMFEKTISLKSNTINYIHWFEFCLYYLVDKIFDDTNEEFYMSYKDFYMGGLVYKNHNRNPIDILHKEFKKLK